jgi:prophage lp1 protein 6
MKVTILVLRIVAIVYFNDDERVPPAPSVLFIVGSSVGLFPFVD